MALTEQTVLVLRFGALGDIVLTTPALAALAKAWPRAKIIYVTKKVYAPIIEMHPAIHQVIACTPKKDGLISLSLRLRKLQPDAVLDLHGSLRSRALCALLTCPSTVRWHKRPILQSLAVRLRLTPYRAQKRIASRAHGAVEELVGQKLPEAAIQVRVNPKSLQKIQSHWVTAGVVQGARRIAIAPGSKWQTKCWPVERYVAIAQRARIAGWEVLVLGNESDRGLAQAMIAKVPQVIDFTGRTTMDELIAMIATCDAMLAGDTGPMHLARALRIPTIALFGPTDPNQFSWQGHTFHFAKTPCAPCSLYGIKKCPKKHHRCMTAIEVDAVWSTLQTAVQRNQ